MDTIKTHDSWYIKPLELCNAEKYIMDINNISFAATGFIHAWESNLFFEKHVSFLLTLLDSSYVVITTVLFTL